MSGISLSTISRKNSPFRLDMRAVELLNEVKSQMKNQVTLLNSLKREVTRSNHLDQGGKSRMRIQIESLLIDLNEEIFAISEDLASAFVESRPDPEELLRKAQEYEQKKVRIFTKIRQGISNNPLMKKIKEERSQSAERQDQEYTPPQRENESRKTSFTRLSPNKSSMTKADLEDSPSDIKHKQFKSFNMPKQIPSNQASFQKYIDRKESVETFGNCDSSPILKNIKVFTESINDEKPIKQVQNKDKQQRLTFPKSRICQSNSRERELLIQKEREERVERSRSMSRSRSRSKSPMQPLRNRADPSNEKQLAPTQDRFGNYKSHQLMNVASQKRSTQRSISKQSLQSKKALNKIYTLDLKKKKSGSKHRDFKRNALQQAAIRQTNSARGARTHFSYKDKDAKVVPKFTGCGPGGIAASMMAINPSKTHVTYSHSSLGAAPTVAESTKEMKRTSDPCDLPRPYKKDSKKHNFKLSYNNIGESSGALSIDLRLGDKSLQKARQDSCRLSRPHVDRLLGENLNYMEPNQSTHTIDVHDQRRKSLETQQYFDIENPLRTIHDTSISKIHQSPARRNASRQTLRQSEVESAKQSVLLLENTMKNIPSSLQNAPADAVLQFSKDFDLMRMKFQSMQNQMKQYTTSIADLNKQVNRLSNENYKLTSDLKLVRVEHSEISGSFREMERKNEDLIRENLTLKDIIYQRAHDRGQELPDRPRSRSASPVAGNANSGIKPFDRPPKPTAVYKPPQGALPPAQRSRSRSSLDRDAYPGDGDYMPLRDRSASPKRHPSSSNFQQILESPFSNAMAKKSSREHVAIQSVGDHYSEPELRDSLATRAITPVDHRDPYVITRHKTERAHLDGPPIPESQLQQRSYACDALAFPTHSARGSRRPSPTIMALQRVQASSPQDYMARRAAVAITNQGSPSGKEAAVVQEVRHQGYSYVNTTQQSQPRRVSPPRAEAGQNLLSDAMRHKSNNQNKDLEEEAGLSSWVLERLKPSGQKMYGSKNIKV